MSDEQPHDEKPLTVPTVDRANAPLARAKQMVTAFASKYNEDDVSLHAMSLTYTTILSLVPLLAVTFSVLKAFGVHDQVEPILAQWLAPLGDGGVSLSERIIDFVRNMQVGVLGAVGVAGLFYTVVMLVAAIENALNRIWHAREGRPWSSKFRDYLSVIMVGPVFVFSALALTASAQQHDFVQRAFALAPWLVWLGTVVLPYVIMASAFTLLYRFMPNTIVTWGAAAVGGITAGIGWKWAGAAFTAFVASSGRYAAIYSSFAILVLFFIWIYVSWLIVLVGAEVAYLWQHPRDALNRMRSATLAGREEIGLDVLLALARSHLAGEPPATVPMLAGETGLPTSTVAEILDQMVEHGLLLEAKRPRGFALARPPESIPIFTALRILRGENGADDRRLPNESAIAAALRARAQAAEAALSGVTLRTLAGEPESESEPPPAVANQLRENE